MLSDPRGELKWCRKEANPQVSGERSKNPKAEECWKPKLLLVRLYKFHFFFHFSYLLFFPLLSYGVLFIFPAQCSCFTSSWGICFVMPVFSGVCWCRNCSHHRLCKYTTTLWPWHTADKLPRHQSRLSLWEIQWGGSPKTAFPCSLWYLGILQGCQGKEPPKGQSSATHSGRPELCFTKENPLITL